MSGNQVKAEAVAAGADDWATRRKMNQRRMIELAEGELMAEMLAGGDTATTDRRVRMITNLARAVVAVEAIKPSSGLTPDQTEEDEMGGRRDDDPAELEALRADLRERYDFFAAQRELRGRAGSDGREGAEAHLGTRSASGDPSDSAGDGLEHLADAGWTGRRQDLRGGVLAA
jgi:hypothetical protein